MSQTRAEQGSTSPGGPEADPAAPPEPEIHPSSTPEGPSTVPTPSAPQPKPERDEALQQENAGTALDQPSVAAASDATGSGS